LLALFLLSSGAVDNHPDTPSAIEADPRRAWQHFWGEICRLVDDTRESLGSHLGDTGLDARSLSPDDRGAAGELVVGRTRFLLQCPYVCPPAGPHERSLAEALGADKPLARIFVYRSHGDDVLRLGSLLAADPACGLWVSTEPALGPAHLGDTLTFEKFFWSLLTG
jgi:hypothetical protein